MVIIETAVFTKRLLQCLTDDEYRKLQFDLIACPDMGAIIPHSGGLRKLRWSTAGRGKRGGLRLIYYWMASPELILMLFIYAKSDQEDLTPGQLRALRRIIDEDYP